MDDRTPGGRRRRVGLAMVRRRRMAIPVVFMLLAAGVPAVAAKTAPPRARATPTAAPTPSDPLAQQLQEAMRRKTAIDATKKKLTGEVQAAQDQQPSPGSLVAAN